MTKLVMKPDVITITGPQTILSQADELLTEIIDINGLKTSKNYQVPLDLEPSFVDLIGQTSVTAEIKVKPKMVEKKVSKVEVKAVIAGEAREVAPKTVDVLLRVPVLLLRDVKDLTRLFSVEVAETPDDKGFLKVSVVPNGGNSLPIEVVSVIPSAVKLVNIEEMPKSEEPEEGISNIVEKIENALKSPAAEGNGEEPPAEKAAPAKQPDEKTIIQLETSGKDASGVKIQPVKTKHVSK